MKFPPQHGAWAFLIVPTLIASFLGAGNLFGVLFALTWIASYPTTYFLGRGLVARLRRGSWTAKAKIELANATAWTVICGVGAFAIVVIRPWIIVEGLVLLLLWALSIYLTWIGRERGVGNDILLMVMSSIAPVLMYQIAKNERTLTSVPREIWICSLLCLLYFLLTVVHVKSLIREATNARWHKTNIAIHLLALLLIAIYGKSLLLSLVFALALMRAILVKPGLRPGAIGGLEAGLSSVFVLFTVLALR